MKKRIDNRGFTLVELIVASALMMIALTMIYSFLFASQQFFKRTSLRADTQSQLRTIMLGLRYEFATAESGTLELSDTPPLAGSLDTDERWFFVNTMPAPNDYEAFFLRTEDGDVPVFTALQLEDLAVTFATVEYDDVSGTTFEAMVEVTLTSGNVELVETFALLNEKRSDSMWGGGLDPSAGPHTFSAIGLKPAR